MKINRRTAILFAWVLGAMLAVGFCQGCAGLTYNTQDQWDADEQTLTIRTTLSLLPPEISAKLADLPAEQLAEVLKAAFAGMGDIHFEPHIEFRQEQGTTADTTQNVSAEVRAILAKEIREALAELKAAGTD